MLSDIEIQALNAILAEAIVESGDEVDPVYHEVKAQRVNPFGDPTIQMAVYDNLARNGLIQCSGQEDDQGHEIVEFVCITAQGWEALKAAKGVH